MTATNVSEDEFEWESELGAFGPFRCKKTGAIGYLKYRGKDANKAVAPYMCHRKGCKAYGIIKVNERPYCKEHIPKRKADEESVRDEEVKIAQQHVEQQDMVDEAARRMAEARREILGW